MKRLWLSVALLLGLLLPISQPASAQDDCGFGLQSQAEEDLSNPDYVKTIPDPFNALVPIYCYKVKWIENDRDDGFTKLVGIEMYADTGAVEFANAQDIMAIFCVKKKFEVYVYVNYAYSVGWSGAGQIRFDNQKAKNMPYILSRSLQSVMIKDSAGFVRNFAKAKDRVILKISTAEYTKILAYPKSDLLSYRAKFKKAGCIY